MSPSKPGILIIRTDSIGDVVLTLPLAGFLKKHNPNHRIIFLAKKYTVPVVETTENVDEVIDWHVLENQSDSAISHFFATQHIETAIHVFSNARIARIIRRANISQRIGTSHRLYYLLTCNKLVNFSRKKSDLHEAQLNFKLLAPLGFKNIPTTAELIQYYGFNRINQLPANIKKRLSDSKINVILHPKSQGSAREWGLPNFERLIELLPENKFQIFVTGTAKEAELMPHFLKNPKIINITGQLNLKELIAFINNADALVAASTGPLHIAAAAGIYSVGIFAPMRPIHPGRWKPIGTNAHYLVLNKTCNACKKGGQCQCIISITPEEVAQKLLVLKKQSPE